MQMNKDIFKRKHQRPLKMQPVIENKCISRLSWVKKNLRFFTIFSPHSHSVNLPAVTHWENGVMSQVTSAFSKLSNDRLG